MSNIMIDMKRKCVSFIFDDFCATHEASRYFISEGFKIQIETINNGYWVSDRRYKLTVFDKE